MPARTTSAILIERHGAPDVLVERVVPLRDPGPHEVRLRVDAAGVNFADLVMRAGMYGTVPPRPYSPGFEVAGEIVQAGAEAAGWRSGDRAVALIRYGGYARELIVPVQHLFRYADGMSPTEAAAVPVAFLTAWVALFETGNARPGDAVLVLSAGGGVGSAAVQLARWRGLRAIGTAGTETKRAFVVQRLGAEACFDSRGAWEQDVAALLGASEETGRLERATHELCAFLVEVLGIRAIPGRFPHRVGLHASCHGLRVLRQGCASERVETAPADPARRLLESIEGVEIAPLRRPDECCGFGGSFAVEEEAVSCLMGNDRIDDHRGAGAEVLTSTDASCLLHLSGIARRRDLSLRVMHVAEILEQACRDAAEASPA